MEYLRTDNLDIAKAALSIVFGEPANTLGSFERALKYDIMLGLARLTKATQGPGLSIFIESFLLDPSGSVTKVYAVEAARLTAFHLTVTRDNLELAFRLFDNAVKMAQEIDESKIPEELKGRYHLYCGSAWSQWAEFSVDHGDALIVMGIIDSYNTIVDNIYRGMTTADGHLSDAIKLLPDDAEARLKYIWNRYYFAKYKDVFEDTINESKSIVEEVSTLRQRGLASPAQYFSAVRCHGWAVTEWANTLASSSPDEVRKPLSELMGILKTVDPKELERKEKIDLYWLTFKTNYVMGKTYPHPTRAIELWMKDREEKDAKAPAMEPLSKEARQYFDNADKALGNVAIAGETDGELMRMLAWLRLRQGRITEALDAFEQALKLGVKHHDDTLNGEMLAYLEQFITEAAKPLAVRLKTLDTAVAVIERRIELGDDWTLSRNTELLQDLAKICTIFSEYGQASESAKRIIKKVENPSLRGSELVSEIQKGCHISNQ
jgi:tetratricopeptide (TPR) repeat protein